MKYIILVPDGMADYPLPELGGKTPLEAARKPNMDRLAKEGMTGLVQTIPAGMKPGSDIGNLAILGYDPKKNFFGRAPLEAASQDIILTDDEIAFRCNLVTVENETMVDYSAGHISTEEADQFIKALNGLKLPEMKFHTGKSYRHLLIIKTPHARQMFGLKTTPPHDIAGKRIQEYLPQGEQAPALLDLIKKSRELFANHPANKARTGRKEKPVTQIWLWGQGIRPTLPSFKEKFNVRGGIISAVDLINGIGKLAGLEVISVPGATGYYDTNYAGKGQYAIDSLKRNDFVFIHVEGPDEAGHNGDAPNKIACIEHIDKDIVGTILKYFQAQEDTRLLILPDHPTPVSLRTHADDPVGFIMYGKGIAKDGSETYGETACQAKGLKFESGEALMEFFMRGRS